VATTTLMLGRSARMSSIRVQNWRRESGSTPVVGSSRTSRSGSWTSAPHSPTFCFMPPESLPAGRFREGTEAGGVEQLLHPLLALGGRETEELRHEVHVVVDGELEVEVLAEPCGMYAICGQTVLRCRTSAMSPPRTVIDPFCSFLDPGEQGHQRGLADAVGPMIPTMSPLGMSRSISRAPLTLPVVVVTPSGRRRRDRRPAREVELEER
jgi:hypothetical protein